LLSLRTKLSALRVLFPDGRLNSELRGPPDRCSLSAPMVAPVQTGGRGEGQGEVRVFVAFAPPGNILTASAQT
jgi:hypothetical protein